MSSLDTLRVHIDDVVKQITLYMRTSQVPENSLASRDRIWGQRTIPLIVNLDEFSPQNLEEAMPQIKTLYAQYAELRRQEREINLELELEHVARRSAGAYPKRPGGHYG